MRKRFLLGPIRIAQLGTAFAGVPLRRTLRLRPLILVNLHILMRLRRHAEQRTHEALGLIQFRIGCRSFFHV